MYLTDQVCSSPVIEFREFPHGLGLESKTYHHFKDNIDLALPLLRNMFRLEDGNHNEDGTFPTYQLIGIHCSVFEGLLHWMTFADLKKEITDLLSRILQLYGMASRLKVPQLQNSSIDAAIGKFKATEGVIC